MKIVTINSILLAIEIPQQKLHRKKTETIFVFVLLPQTTFVGFCSFSNTQLVDCCFVSRP